MFIHVRLLYRCDLCCVTIDGCQLVLLIVYDQDDTYNSFVNTHYINTNQETKKNSNHLEYDPFLRSVGTKGLIKLLTD